MQIHRVFDVLMRGFRRRRMRRFAAQFEPREETCILDVGGSAYNWRLAPVPGCVTLLNLAPPGDAESGDVESRPGGFRWIRASGTGLPHRDGAFDIAFSNSVIEHLGSYERQRVFADELQRVGRGLWVQTPARWFPFEPHLLTPLIHYLPKTWQARLLRRFTVWGWLTSPSPERVALFLRETRLLTGREMASLFPDCEIRRERFLGLTRCYIAVR